MPLIDNPRHAPKYSFTHEELIATLDAQRRRARGDRGGKPVGRLQRLHLAALRAHPKRLRGTAIFKPTMDRFALEAMSRDGLVGVRLPFIGLPKLPDITDLRLSRVVPPPRRSRLARPSARRRRGPAENPADAGSLRRQDRGRSSRPARSEAPASTAKASRRCCARSTRAAPGSRCRAATGSARRRWTMRASLLRVAGPDRLVWASDCPFVGHEGQFPYQATIDWLDECVPDAAARAKIFGETALQALFQRRVSRGAMMTRVRIAALALIAACVCSPLAKRQPAPNIPTSRSGCCCRFRRAARSTSSRA